MMSSGTISVFIGMLPEMKTTEPYSPTALRKGQREPGEQRRCHRGKDDSREGLPAPGAETGGGLFHVDIEIVEHRLHGADDERETDEDECHRYAEPGIRDFDPQRVEVLPDPAVGCIQRRERDAGDGGRQSEWKVHSGIDQPPARKPVAHQDPGYQETEHGVDHRRNKRCAERHPIGGQYARGRNGRPEGGPREIGRAGKHGGERNQHHQAQVGAGDPEGHAEPGQHTPRLGPHGHPFVGVDVRPGLTTRLVELVEHAAIREVSLLRLPPTAEDVSRA